MIEISFLLDFRAKFPMVKIIEQGDKLFAYDAKSNFLTEITSYQLHAIYDLQTKPLNSNDVPDFLIVILKKKLFKPQGIKKLTPSPTETADLVREELANQIPRKCTLEITEKCTLRCSYCFYTNKEEDKRKHSDLSMEKEVAFKAIELYYNRYVSAISKIPEEKRKDVYTANPPVLTWWGGEPLADFELLKSTKNFIESLDWEKYNIRKNDIRYSMVTNFTILNKSIIDFLAENKINLQVSLDGDEEEHNRNRIFPNGEGSFNTVISNINLLIKLQPEYARNHLTINTVLADNLNHEKVSSFLKQNFEIGKTNRKILMWSPTYERKEGEFMPNPSFSHDKEHQLKQFRESLNKLQLKQDNIDAILIHNKVFYKELQDLFLLEQQIVFDNPTGTDYLLKTFSCPIGSDTYFVDVSGKIHCCCKIEYSFPLGDVFSGLNSELIEHLYNSYFDEIEKKCKNCWAINFCKICPALVCWDGKFKLPSNNECENIKNIIETNLSKYIILSSEYESLYEAIFTYFEKSSKDYRFDSLPTKVSDYT